MADGEIPCALELPKGTLTPVVSQRLWLVGRRDSHNDTGRGWPVKEQFHDFE
jgi:hypothetical protein